MPLFILILLSFLVINLIIVSSDFKEKRIPNTYLLFLLWVLWIYYIYLYTYWFQFSGYFFIQIVISFIISFILYYFWIWSAWDAKYLLILALFIPNIWIIPLIWNTALITLLYLVIYCIYFYLKLIFHTTYRKSLMDAIFVDHRDAFMNFIRNPLTWEITKKDAIVKITRHTIYFLLFFVSVRLVRWDILEYLKTAGYIKTHLIDAWSYSFWIVGLLSLMLMFFYRRIVKRIARSLVKIKDRFFADVSGDVIKGVNIFTVLLLLVGVLVFDYQRMWNILFHKLYTILTLYLLLYLFAKTLFYWYKLTFQTAEQDVIHIKMLREWDIIDKKFLIKMFGEQEALWYGDNKKWMFYPDPWVYFHNIENPITQETVTLLNKIYNTVNLYHKKRNEEFKKNEEIKILKTFAFWWYIFIWFLITYIWGDSISRSIIQGWITLFQHFMYH